MIDWGRRQTELILQKDLDAGEAANRCHYEQLRPWWRLYIWFRQLRDTK